MHRTLLNEPQRQEAAATLQAGWEDGQKTVSPDQGCGEGSSRDWDPVPSDAAGRCVLDERDGRGLRTTHMLSARGGGVQSYRLSAQMRVSRAIPGAQSWSPGSPRC